MCNSGMSRRDFLWSASVVAFSGCALREYATGQGASFGTVRSLPLWNLAETRKDVLTLTGWFTAQDVDNLLSTTAGLDNAVKWCKQNGVTKVHLESFGRGLYADRKTLIDAKTTLLKEGFAVQSGVTTVKFGKNGFGDDFNAECYTDKGTQEELQRIFEYAASMFDQIIIDDWYFTQCQCVLNVSPPVGMSHGQNTTVT